VKCPSGTVLIAPTKALAEKLQAEWSAQENTIVPDTMPLTQILTTQIDRVSRERNAMETALFKYLDTDLLCYRAGADPAGQREAQEQMWNPWLDWFKEKFGVNLETTHSITALTQPEEAHKKVRDYITALDDARFTAMQLVAALSGSIILGLAFAEHAITPQQIFDCTHVEEDFKGRIYDKDKYGLDPLEEKKDAAMMRDLKAAEKFLKLLD